MYLNHRNALITLVKNRELFPLLILLPLRFAMDLGIGFAELASRRPGRLTAVVAGWLEFIALLRVGFASGKLYKNCEKTATKTCMR